jgi:hypothetical protein
MTGNIAKISKMFFFSRLLTYLFLKPKIKTPEKYYLIIWMRTDFTETKFTKKNHFMAKV